MVAAGDRRAFPTVSQQLIKEMARPPQGKDSMHRGTAVAPGSIHSICRGHWLESLNPHQDLPRLDGDLGLCQPPVGYPCILPTCKAPAPTTEYLNSHVKAHLAGPNIDHDFQPFDSLAALYAAAGQDNRAVAAANTGRQA
ncbi:MAG: hypothetical protein ASARMPREDX12_003093 [Alectoria sarmentosa]|nr:MAG: hypothetical protein ASARMPREDX12_003093 [Alectoria sarmentosa]